MSDKSENVAMDKSVVQESMIEPVKAGDGEQEGSKHATEKNTEIASPTDNFQHISSVVEEEHQGKNKAIEEDAKIDPPMENLQDDKNVVRESIVELNIEEKERNQSEVEENIDSVTPSGTLPEKSKNITVEEVLVQDSAEPAKAEEEEGGRNKSATEEDEPEEESSDENITEKQDAEEVKEIYDKMDREESLGDFKAIVGIGEDTISFGLLDVEEDEQVEEIPQEEEKPVATPKKKKSTKRDDQDRPSIAGSMQVTIPGATISAIKSDPVIEEVVVEEEEEEPLLTKYARAEYYEKYNNLAKQYYEEKKKNQSLSLKLVNYYTQRRMFHVFYEGKSHLDVAKKYEKQLDDFERLTNESEMELKQLEQDVHDLEAKFAQKEHQAQVCFEELQHREYEVGKAAVDSESGTSHDEKTVDRYLKHQKIQLNNLKKIRFEYIKVRNKVTKIEEALNALDNLGPNLRLMDYEQLKLDNRNLLDKLEEKDMELAAVKLRCDAAVQFLAHRREKSDALEQDLIVLEDRIGNVMGEAEDVREQVKKLRQERDSYRNSTEKMKEKAGLLSKPKLLCNLAKLIEEGEFLGKKVREIRNACETITEKVVMLRKNKTSETNLRIIIDKMNMDGIVVNMESLMSTPSFSSTGNSERKK